LSPGSFAGFEVVRKNVVEGVGGALPAAALELLEVRQPL